MKTRRATTYMGFFDMEFNFIVTDSIEREYRRYERKLGPIQDENLKTSSMEGLAVRFGNEVYVFIRRSRPRRRILPCVLAHELRHASDYMHKARRIEPCQEIAALTSEYLTRTAFHYLRRWKEKVA